MLSFCLKKSFGLLLIVALLGQSLAAAAMHCERVPSPMPVDSHQLHVMAVPDHSGHAQHTGAMPESDCCEIPGKCGSGDCMSGSCGLNAPVVSGGLISGFASRPVDFHYLIQIPSLPVFPLYRPPIV